MDQLPPPPPLVRKMLVQRKPILMRDAGPFPRPTSEISPLYKYLHGQGACAFQPVSTNSLGLPYCLIYPGGTSSRQISAETVGHGLQMDGFSRRKRAAFPHKMSAFCSTLRKSAARIASTPGATCSAKSEPNMMRLPKPPSTSPRR